MKRLFKKWIGEYNTHINTAAKLRFFKLRWIILKKKIYLRRLKLETLKIHS